MRICFTRENWQAKGMSHGKNYRLGFRFLRFYCSTKSTFNQLQHLHLWVNANLSDAQHFYLENEMSGSSEDSPFCQWARVTKKPKNREIWTCQNSFIEDFLKIILNQVRVGMEICRGILSPTVAFFKPHPVQKAWYVNFFLTSLEYLQGEKLWWVCITRK